MTRQAILSTKTGSYTNTVQLSVMPKGVEHLLALVQAMLDLECNYQ